MSDEDAAARSAEDRAIELFKIKKLIKSLERAKGSVFASRSTFLPTF
jgi:hypothetical protein